MTHPNDFLHKTLNGGGRYILLRLLFQLVVTAFAAGGVYFSITNRVSTNEKGIKELHEWLDKVDTRGTTYSQVTDPKQNQLIEFNIHRIDAIELELKVIGPKLDRIDANLQWLMAKQGKP